MKKPFSKGSLTVQFMLGFVFFFIFIILFCYMSFTLAVSGVVQYITYSSARALFLGGGSLNKQKEAAENKFKSLEEEFNFFHENVFKIEDIEDSKEFNHDYEPGSDDRNNNFNLFYGVWTTFTPKLLAWDPPFMAGVETNGDGGDFFKTIIGSYLGREPSVEECKEFRRDERWKNIKELHGDAYPISLPDNIPESEPDNGC